MRNPALLPLLFATLAVLPAACGGDEPAPGTSETSGDAGASGASSSGKGGSAGNASAGNGAASGAGGRGPSGAGGQAGATNGVGAGASGGFVAGGAGAGSGTGGAGGDPSGEGGKASGGATGGSGGKASSGGNGGTAGKGGSVQAEGGQGGAGGKAPLPVCECFVKEAWCGSGVAKEAAAKGCSVPLLPAHAGDILACPGGKWSVKEACTGGCVEAPAGTADTCKAEPCDLATVKSAAYLVYGLHPDASDALRQIGLDAGDISQTIGSAAASAGTHAKDGTAEGKDYSAATDIRVVGLTQAQIKTRLEKLAEVGFAAWYRWPGHDGWPSNEAPHIHAIWVGAKMKLSLRDQVRDWIVGKNGLQSHTTYTFYTWEKCRRDAIWERYLKNNPAKN